MKKIKNSKADLISRVKKAKEFLKFHNVKDAKSEFFDKIYGALYKSESSRLDNLWACKTTEIDFTELLELFAEKPTTSNVKESMEFKRFIKFVDWYVALGGTSLTLDQIEKVYPKFEIKKKKSC